MNEANLRAYIINPKAVVPAVPWPLPGCAMEQQLNDLIAYLRRATGAN
jgi:cytochrome c2